MGVRWASRAREGSLDVQLKWQAGRLRRSMSGACGQPAGEVPARRHGRMRSLRIPTGRWPTVRVRSLPLGCLPRGELAMCGWFVRATCGRLGAQRKAATLRGRGPSPQVTMEAPARPGGPGANCATRSSASWHGSHAREGGSFDRSASGSRRQGRAGPIVSGLVHVWRPIRPPRSAIALASRGVLPCPLSSRPDPP